ncbi:MAG: NTP transferase domain-containing protein [Bacteroidetes bacterium]|nr:NTP transferase domain-containing protein [Bacteroidota bacterium]
MKRRHQKHAKIVRPDVGIFGRQEYAIIGTPCNNIKSLVSTIIEALSDKHKIGYVDADHKKEGSSDNFTDAFQVGASVEYTDKISHHQLNSKTQPTLYQFKSFFNEMDAVFVNGNHFKAVRQIVVVDPKKEESLQRKLNRLNNVQLILLPEGTDEVFPFLKNHIQNIKNIPVLRLEDTTQIIQFFKEKLEAAVPPLFGLVLAGGKSQRMGQDKGLVDYHGKPQRDYLTDLLSEVCLGTCLSCREDQVKDLHLKSLALPDTFTGLGPYGAILSAFREFPNNAWLVVACDLPLIDKTTLQFLIKHRNPAKIATTFHNPATGFPEPLITIWEPKSYSVLLQYLAQGYSCPRKALINSDVQLLNAPNPEVLKNVNYPEELKEIRQLLS